MIQARIVYQSLLPDSRMLKLGIGLTIFAATLGNVANVPLYTALLAGLLAVALGYSARRYRQSEICKQVPGLFRAQAIAALQVAFCLWVLFFLPAIGLEGSFMFAAGSCFLTMAIGLCIGAGEWFLVFWLFAAGLLASASVKLWFKLPVANESVWPNWPPVVFESIGASMLLGGIVFIFRFWKLLNQPSEIVTSVASSKLSTASDSCQDWEEFANERELQKLPRSQIFRLKKLLEIEQAYRTRDYIWLGLSLAIVLSAIVFSRGIESSVMFVQYIAAGAVMGAPAMVFFQRIRQSFERLWLIGSSTTRVETVRRKVVLASWNCFVFLLFVVAASGVALAHQFTRLCDLDRNTIGCSWLRRSIANRKLENVRVHCEAPECDHDYLQCAIDNYHSGYVFGDGRKGRVCSVDCLRDRYGQQYSCRFDLCYRLLGCLSAGWWPRNGE